MIIKHAKKLIALIFIALLLAGCNKNKIKCTGDSEKNFTHTGFDKITASENFNLIITKGTTFSIKAKGCTESVNDLQMSINTGNILNIFYNSPTQQHEMIDIFITMPQLVAVNVQAASKATVNGMAGQPFRMRIVLSGASECNVNGTAIQTNFDLSGASKLELSGTTNILTGMLSGASHLKAYGLLSKEVDIYASGASDAYILVQDKLTAEASGASNIRYKGNPPVVQTNASGASKIIRE